MTGLDCTDLYITNTETLYPSNTDYNEVVIRLYGRTEDNVAKTITVQGYEPYFYAPAEEESEVPQAEVEDIKRYEETDFTPLRDRFAHRTPWQDAQELVKVVVERPGDIPGVSDHFSKTWAADTIFTERFRIDKDIRTGVRVPTSSESNHLTVDHEDIEPVEMTDVAPRTVTLDIETDDRDTGFPDPGDARILSIAAHDSYEQETVVFLDLDGQSFETFFDLNAEQAELLAENEFSLDDLGLEHVDELNFEANERRMLIAFASWVSDHNPDLLCGWNSADDATDGFDFPHLIERMAAVNAQPGRLCRDDGVEVKPQGQVHIGGRSVYDLMDGWEDTKFTNPRSTRLEYVAGEALDDAKIEHSEMGYYEMYDEDSVTFTDYNAKDTKLTVDITEAENILGFKKRLKDMIGVDWERTHENNEFIEMSVRRKCHEHNLVMLTSYDNEHVQKALESGDDGVNYEGAWVGTAFSGVRVNVAGVDLASLYPMTQWMLNASPDTRIDRAKAFKHDIPHVVAENGQTFRDDVDGIIRELVDEYHQVKREFKQERNAADYGTATWNEAAEAYNVTKTIYNSYYGYSGWDKSPLYNPRDAAAITLTGQRVIKRTAEYISEEAVEGVEVIYGDTDSNYLQFPNNWGQIETLEYAEGLCETLTEEIYPDLCSSFNIPAENNRWEIEVEMRAERMFQAGSKKQYAYLKTWDEGDPHEKVVGTDTPASELDWSGDEYGKFDVTGFPCVKSNFSLITKETQEEILEAIVRGRDNSEVASILHDAAAGIDAADPDWERLGMPQGLGKKLDAERSYHDDYYTFTNGTPKGAHPRGAYFANQLLDVDYGDGSNPLRAYIRPSVQAHDANGDSVAPTVIGYETERDLEPIADELKMDVPKMQEKVLRNPMEDVFNAIGEDVDAALEGQMQSGLEAFA